jgi:hypothetical protein
MGPTALLPIRRKACCGFFRPEKSDDSAHVELKAKVVPVIIEATGTISESLREYLSDIPVKHEIKELQKTAVVDTAHVLRKVIM